MCLDILPSRHKPSPDCLTLYPLSLKLIASEGAARIPISQSIIVCCDRSPLLPPSSSLPRPRRRSYVYAFYLEKSGNHKANFEMQQSQLEMQTEELAGLLERDVKDIQRTEASHQPPPSRTSSSAPAPACQPATARVSADSTAAPPRAPGPGHPT